MTRALAGSGSARGTSPSLPGRCAVMRSTMVLWHTTTSSRYFNSAAGTETREKQARVRDGLSHQGRRCDKLDSTAVGLSTSQRADYLLLCVGIFE